MSAFLDFKDSLLKWGLEYFGLYYGSYTAIVTNREDPEKLGRIQVQCDEIWGDEKIEHWINPKGMFAGKKIGFHALPQKEDVVWISFRGGKPDPEYAMWEYGWWTKDNGIPNVEHDMYILATPKGHTWVIDEKNNIIKFVFKDGKAILIDKNKVYLAKENASIPAVLGDKNAGLHKNAIQLSIDIINAIQNAATVPQDGGASFKAAMVSALAPALVQANTYKSNDADATKSTVVFLE